MMSTYSLEPLTDPSDSVHSQSVELLKVCYSPLQILDSPRKLIFDPNHIQCYRNIHAQRCRSSSVANTPTTQCDLIYFSGGHPVYNFSNGDFLLNKGENGYSFLDNHLIEIRY